MAEFNLLTRLTLLLALPLGGACHAQDGERLALVAGNKVSIETRDGVSTRQIVEVRPRSYVYRNQKGQTVESIFGVIDVNGGSNQWVEADQRRRLENTALLTVGQRIDFHYTGDSGYGVWNRAVNVNVSAEDTIDWRGTAHRVLVLDGLVEAADYYRMKFRCWYAETIKSCLKAQTDVQSRRNPGSNGVNFLTLKGLEP